MIEFGRLGLLFFLGLSAARADPAVKVFPHPDRIRYDGQCLTIDGRDTFIFSGSFHYFRCPKALWSGPIPPHQGGGLQRGRNLRALELARNRAAGFAGRFFPCRLGRAQGMAAHGPRRIRPLHHHPPRPLHLRGVGRGRLPSLAFDQGSSPAPSAPTTRPSWPGPGIG